MLPLARTNNDNALGPRGLSQQSTDVPAPAVTGNPVPRRLPGWVAKVPSRVLNVPVRVGRTLIGQTSNKSAPSSGLAETAPNALRRSHFTQSQHNSSGLASVVPKARNALASLTPEQMQIPAEGGIVNRNNEVEARQMREFALALDVELTQANAMIDRTDPDGTALPGPLKKKLRTEIEELSLCLERCKHLHSVKTNNAHQLVRDNYAEIAKRTQALVRHFPKSVWPTVNSRNVFTTTDANDKPVAEVGGRNIERLAHFFDDLSKLSTEVKRQHYDRSLDIRLEQFAEDIYNNWLIMAPAFALQRKGSEISYSKEFSAGVTAGVDLGNVGIVDELLVGGRFKYSYTLLNRLFVDRDGDTASTNTVAHSGKFGVITRIGRLWRSDRETGKLVNVFADVKVATTSGEYHDFKNWKAFIKAEVMRDANERWSLSNPLPKAPASGISYKQSRAQAIGRYVMGDVLGILNVDKSLPPAVNQQKRDKGAYNSTKIRELAKKLSLRLPREEGDAPSRLAECTEKLYPTAEAAFASTEAKITTWSHDIELEESMRSSVSDFVALPGPANLRPIGERKSLQKREIEFSAGAGFSMLNFNSALGRRMRLVANAGVNLNLSRTSIGFLRLKPPHEHLDPGYNKNIDRAEGMLEELRKVKIGSGDNEVESPTVFYHKNIYNELEDKPEDLIQLTKPATPSPVPVNELDTATAAAAAAAEYEKAERVKAEAFIKNPNTIHRNAETQFNNLNKIRASYIKLMDLASSHRAFSGEESRLKKSYADRNIYSRGSFKKTTYAEENHIIYSLFRKKLDVFIKETFGIDPNECNYDQKRFYEELVNDPEFFMIKSYNTLSTALGVVGIEMYKQKEAAHALIAKGLDNASADDIMSDLRVVDISYMSLRNGMDSVSLPISKEKLLRGSSIHATCNSDNQIYKLEVEAGVALDMSPIGALPNNGSTFDALARNPSNEEREAAKLPNGQPADDDPMKTVQSSSVRPPSSTFGVGLKATYSRLNAELHPNPWREGAYDQIRLSSKGDGLAAVAIKHAIKSAVESLNHTEHFKVDQKVQAKLGLNKNDKANSEIMGRRDIAADQNRFIEESVTVAKRSLFSHYTGEWEFTRDTLRPNPLGEYTYQRTTQFHRYTARRTQKMGLNGGVALMVPKAAVAASGTPVTPTANIEITHADGNVLFETIGINPSYQILCFEELLAVLDKAPVKGAIVPPHKKTIDASKLMNECDFDKLQKLFLGKPIKSVEGKDVQPIDAEYELNKYFGTHDSIIGFLEHFLKYQDGQREFDPQNLRNTEDKAVREGDRSEFDRLDDKDEYWDLIKRLAQAEKFKPGTDIYKKGEGGALVKGFKEELTPDPRPKIEGTVKIKNAEGVEEVRNARDVFDEAKRELERMQKDGEIKVPADRLKYFMTNEKGKHVFAMYTNVLNGYYKINEALKSSTTYGSTVVEK